MNQDIRHRLRKLLVEDMADSQRRIDYGLKPEVWNPRVLEIIELAEKLTFKELEKKEGQ